MYTYILSEGMKWTKWKIQYLLKLKTHNDSNESHRHQHVSQHFLKLFAPIIKLLQ